MGRKFFSNLLEVEKPVRYIDGEHNSYIDANADLSVALAFPDTYGIGMSNLGFLIIYHLLNSIEGINCERVFTPWLDAGQLLEQLNETLTSLETRKPLNQFDVVAFSIHSELNYTNILNILDLGDIPVQSRDRVDNPIVVGGGFSCYNPEPLTDFFDCFVIGEGEEVAVELFNTLLHIKRDGNFERDEIFSQIKGIGGIYIPSLYGVEGDRWSTPVPEDDAPEIIGGRVVKDIENMFHIDKPIVPNFQIVHDRVSVEIARGCINGCRFCQSGMVTRPARERSPQKIVDIVFQSLKNTGYDKASLLSLNSVDYSQLEVLLSSLSRNLKDSKVSVSLPSLRVDCPYIEMLYPTQMTRPTQLTFAPEVASESLQRRINKFYDRENLYGIIKNTFAWGVKSIKLYFMIGLPFEEDEDVLQINDMVRELLDIVKSENRNGRLVLHISPFIPKPHTPFQWSERISEPELKERFEMLKRGLPRKNVELRWQDLGLSYLESILSRGDRRLGEVIHKAYEMGASFEGWSENLDLDIWRDAFHTTGLDPEFYIEGPTTNDELPWGHINTGPDVEYLLKEWEKSTSGVTSESCSDVECRRCGVCDGELELKFASIEDDIKFPEVDERMRWIRRHTKIHGRGILRFIFSKSGDMVYISHLDLMRMFELAFRRAEIPIKYSKGYNPRQKLSLARALSLGVEARGELGEIELEEPYSPIEFVENVNRTLPDGIEIEDAKLLGEGAPEMHSFDIQRLSFYFPPELNEELSIEERVESLSLDRTVEFERRGSVKEFLLRKEIKSLNVESTNNDLLKVRGDLAISSDSPSMRIDEFLSLIIPEGYDDEVEIICDGIFITLGDEVLPPMDKRLLGN